MTQFQETVKEQMELAPPRGSDSGAYVEFMNRMRLLRIGMMLHKVLDEASRTPLDPAGAHHSKQIYERAVGEVKQMLDPDLRQEFDSLAPPFATEEPGESELRLAEAQLVGWLQGIFTTAGPAALAQRPAPSSMPTASNGTDDMPGTYL